MIFHVLGEGSSDFGSWNVHTLKKGCMNYLLDWLWSHHSPQGMPLPKQKLHSRDAISKTDPRAIGSRGHHLPKQTRFAFMGAIALAHFAQAENETAGAVYFTDADHTRSEDKDIGEKLRDAIQQGFDFAAFGLGVPMVPNPNQEAWLLAYYQRYMPKQTAYNHAERFEALAGNSRAKRQNNPKEQLSECLEKAGLDEREDEEEIVNRVDWNRVSMPSYDIFKRIFLNIVAKMRRKEE